MNVLDGLNERFGLKDALRFEEGPGGLTLAKIATDAATAEIYLQGAHVAAWQPASAEHPVLFMSARSHFAAGKAIRGGVPLVFPWFADRTGGLPGPAHGFARTMEWEVVAAERRAEGVALSFKLLPNQTTRDLGFDHFVLVYEVIAGATLTLRLEVENVGDSPLTLKRRCMRISRSATCTPLRSTDSARLTIWIARIRQCASIRMRVRSASRVRLINCT